MPDSHRPLLAIVAHTLAPYRLRLHTRIAREIPEVEIATLVLNRRARQPWSLAAPPEINLHWMAPENQSRSRNGSVLRIWQQAGRVIRWLGGHQPAAVVVTGYRNIGRARIIRWCRRHSVPVYLFSDSNVAGDTAQGWRRLVKRPYVAWCVRSVSGLLVCGRAGVEYYRQYGGGDRPCFYVPHEGDYDLIDAITDDQTEAVRQRFGLRPGRPLIAYCGRLAEVKRVDLLIDAFAAIAAERPDWDLLIIGDGPLRDELKARVPPALRDRVIWTGFIGEREVLGALYRAPDVFVLPSQYEPWGAVVSEAAAAGLALVCSDVVGAGFELVQDGVNGRLFRSGGAGSLIEALRDVTVPERCRAMQRASAEVLAHWRRRGDPVDGIRAMLAHAGVLPAESVGGQPAEGVQREGAAGADRRGPALGSSRERMMQ